MTKKTNPIGFRLRKTQDWTSEWFTMDKNEFVHNVFNDYLIRQEIKNFYKNNAISNLKISRIEDKTKVVLTVDNAIVFNGKNNYLINNLRKKLNKIENNIDINVEQSDFITARYVSSVLSNVIKNNKISWKLVLRKLVRRISEQNTLGYKIMLNGRLNNSDKHKCFKITHGKISLNTISNSLDYSYQVAVSKVGTISVKTWINHATIS